MSDRTPADVIAELFAQWRGMTPFWYHDDAVAVLHALAAAGFRVVPIPDEDTRALAIRLRVIARFVLYDDAADLLAAAALLDGQPEDRADRCPECGSRSPQYAVVDRANPSLDVCDHPWHVGGSGDTR